MPAARRTRLLKWLWRVHRWTYRVSSGRIGSRVFRIPVLRLTTVGRMSGRPRSVMLYYFRHSQSFVVIASNAGDPRNPGWFGNLKANPGASVQIGADRLEVVARVASVQERQRLWPKAVELDASYEEYQRRTERQIPLVILDPIREPEQVPRVGTQTSGLE